MKLFSYVLLLGLVVSCQEHSRLSKKNYSSELKTGVSIDEEHIEFLDLFGAKMTTGCELELRAGDVLDYKIVDEKLQLSNAKTGEKLELNRVAGEAGSIIGIWEASVSRPNYHSDIEITIPNHYDISVIEKCRYGK